MSLIIFLKAGDKLPTIIFNTYTVILQLSNYSKAQHGWGNNGKKDNGMTMMRMGATTPDEGMTALTQHLPHHSEHGGCGCSKGTMRDRGRTGTTTTTRMARARGQWQNDNDRH